MTLKEQVNNFELNLITDALKKCNGHVVDSAKYLKVNRTTLWEKIYKYKLGENLSEKYRKVDVLTIDPIYKISGLNNLKHNAALDSLKKNNWNRTHTANELGIALRTLRYWIKHMVSMGVNIEYSQFKRKRRNYG